MDGMVSGDCIYIQSQTSRPDGSASRRQPVMCSRSRIAGSGFDTFYSGILRGKLAAMGDKGKFKTFSPSTDASDELKFTEEQRLGPGKIEFDELGNAVWVPASTAAGEDTLRRLLDDPNLTFSDEYSRGTVRPAENNPLGLKKGYDPYDSGLLAKKEWKKKKDLKRLSQWIQSRKSKQD